MRRKVVFGFRIITDRQIFCCVDYDYDYYGYGDYRGGYADPYYDDYYRYDDFYDYGYGPGPRSRGRAGPDRVGL